MRLNDTTRTYFEKLASVSAPERAAIYKALLDTKAAAGAQKFLREHSPGEYSMLRTSVVPTMLNAGVGANVIPSEAEATLDIRALPDEDIEKFYAEMAKVIADPAVKIVPIPQTRPRSPASRLDTEMYRVMEQVAKSDLSRRRGAALDVDRRQRPGSAARQGDPVLRHRPGLNGIGRAQLSRAR